MADLTSKSLGVSMKFANGTTASGGTKVMSVSIGQLDKDAFDAGKAYALASALSRVYSQLLVSVDLSRVDYITN